MNSRQYDRLVRSFHKVKDLAGLEEHLQHTKPNIGCSFFIHIADRLDKKKQPRSFNSFISEFSQFFNQV